MAPEPSIRTKCRFAGAALGALMAGSLATGGVLAAISSTQAQDRRDIAKAVQLTPAQCRDVAGFVADQFTPQTLESKLLGVKFGVSVMHFITPDTEAATCDGKAVLDDAMCRNVPRTKTPAYLISPDTNTVVCNPGTDDRNGVPIIIITAPRELSAWTVIEESSFEAGIDVARAVRLVADPMGHPSIPGLLEKRQKALAARDGASGAPR
jgi:hypothetical protein